MTTCVYIVTALLVITKLCDVVSTIHMIKGPDHETNSIARYMMLRIGTANAAWLIFLVALAIIGISAVEVLKSGLLVQGIFILIGTAISLVQAAVAYFNYTGNNNAIIGYVNTLHRTVKIVDSKAIIMRVLHRAVSWIGGGWRNRNR